MYLAFAWRKINNANTVKDSLLTKYVDISISDMMINKLEWLRQYFESFFSDIFVKFQLWQKR